MNEWVLSDGGMILTRENWSTGRKTLYSVGGRWMNEYGGIVEWYWQGKTEVLGEKHYTAWVVDEWMSVEHWWNDTDRRAWSTRRKICPSATSSATNPIRTGLSLNTSRRNYFHLVSLLTSRKKNKIDETKRSAMFASRRQQTMRKWPPLKILQMPK